jgi:hypothetical protein
MITAYCLDWHINVSGAFHKILIDPLINFNLHIDVKSWDGSGNISIKENDQTIFLQIAPTSEIINNTKRNIIWVPMWDQAIRYTQNWWNNLPQKIKIISFSEQIYQRAKLAGLRVLNVKYYPNPAEFQGIDWGQSIGCTYWNRRETFHPRQIVEICKRFQIKNLYIINRLDQYIRPSLKYEFRGNLPSTNIKYIENYISDAEYKRILNNSHIYLAPRLLEGVGLSFLEAMAGGSLVLAPDSPTMNEYISHMQNGLLFPINKNPKCGNKLINSFLKKNFRSFFPLDLEMSNLTKEQLIELGNNARNSINFGFNNWQKHLIEIVNFIKE